MQNNKIIRIALITCKTSLALYALAALAMTFVLIHWHFSPGSYTNVEITNAFRIGYTDNAFNITYNQSTIDSSAIYLSELSSGMVFWLSIRILLFLILSFLIIRAIIKVLTSINNLETFRKQNVQSFRRIGQYVFLVFLLSSFNFACVGRKGIHCGWNRLRPAFTVSCILCTGRSLQ